MLDIVERGAQLVSASSSSNYSLDVLPYVHQENLRSILPAMLPSFEGVTAGSLASSIFNIWTISKLLLVIIVAANFKNFPLVYHVSLYRCALTLKKCLSLLQLRLLNAVRFVLKSQRGQKAPTPSQLFQPIITSSRNSLSETDVYMHSMSSQPPPHLWLRTLTKPLPTESNSTYFSDNDVARAHLVCTLFSHGIEKIRGGTAALVDGKKSPFGFALGAVSCSFRKEIKPYEKYEMWTRVLTWDHKWLYIVTHFVRKDAAQPHGISLYPSQRSPPGSRRSSVIDGSLNQNGEKKPVIFASALSKCVFKRGHITIAPEIMLEASGLLPPKPESDSVAREGSPDPMVKVLSKTETSDVLLHAVASLNPSNEAAVKNTQSAESDRKRSTTEKITDSNPDDLTEQPSRRTSADWTRHAIEIERLRGLEVAKHLAKQESLENHFNSDTDALGRHRDGTGITGVVTTLAQLGKLSNTQFL